MCRLHDRGPYRAENVRIDTVKGIAAERGLFDAVTEEDVRAI